MPSRGARRGQTTFYALREHILRIKRTHSRKQSMPSRGARRSQTRFLNWFSRKKGRRSCNLAQHALGCVGAKRGLSYGKRGLFYGKRGLSYAKRGLFTWQKRPVIWQKSPITRANISIAESCPAGARRGQTGSLNFVFLLLPTHTVQLGLFVSVLGLCCLKLMQLGLFVSAQGAVKQGL